MKRLLALLLFCITAACNAQNPPSQIAIYGDSTIEGATSETGTPTVTTDNAPAQLQRMLTAAGYNAVVYNYGIGGATTGSLLNGVAGISQSWVATMSASTANLVIINEGLNDASQMYQGLETMAQFTANYTQIIQIAQSYGKIVYIETSNPRQDSIPESYQETVNAALWNVVASIPGTRFISMNQTIVTNFPQWPQHLPGPGLHPDDTLYTYKAIVELYALAPQLTLIPLPVSEQ